MGPYEKESLTLDPFPLPNSTLCTFQLIRQSVVTADQEHQTIIFILIHNYNIRQLDRTAEVTN